MKIKHNISAMTVRRNRSTNTDKLKKSLEKLSSGYRINRAGDDAAGLAVSEKMRALISGMERAEDNIKEGIALIQVGEGALQEVHDMLDRLKELAVQSSDGVYSDDPDRIALQAELEAVCEEIDRIASSTNFNSIPLFQDEGLEAETSSAYVVDVSEVKLAQKWEPTLASLLSKRSNKLENIVYTETIFDFETEQSASGVKNVFGEEYKTIANTLQTSIVPQVVSNIIDTYPAFNYLNGSSIGIGLDLYSDSSSSTLASVALKTTYSTSDGVTTSDMLGYQLRVNVAGLDLSTEKDRNALEQTIAHEMIHAFMDEATTVGMTGITSSGKDEGQKFPGWFVEGMAQTASGPGNWTQGVSLGLTASATVDQIQSALSGNNALGQNTPASEYGTGYLACMYLGYLASGATANMSNPTEAADAIADGLSTMLESIISGDSLQDVVGAITGGKYPTIAAFESGFASDTDAQAFVQGLLQYTSTPNTDGNVGGGLVGGDLSNTDPVANESISGLNLFALDIDNTEVNNKYPSNVTVLSGGGLTVSGVSPVTTPTISYPEDLFTVEGGTEGVDWSFDEDTGTLSILTDATLTISGGTFPGVTRASGDTLYGNIKIEDGVNANLILSGVEINTKKKGAGDLAGIEIGNGCNVAITIKEGTINTITGSGNCAGIQLTGNYIHGKDAATRETEHNAINDSSVIITLAEDSELKVTGGTSSSKGGAGIGAAWATDTSKSNITINGTGTLHAEGGMGAAGIGGSEGGNIGEITIESTTGLNITSVGGQHGAGIGGGGWVSNYPNGPQHVESITILGAVAIEASSKFHGTGIGSGCHGSVGVITIGSDTGDNSKINIIATGGDDGAGIGSGWDSKMDSVVIHGGTIEATAGKRGAGIGSGYEASGGPIQINGGNITATGATNSAGIGGGMNGTIDSITITGGTITADGGWSNDGGNIGGYTDAANTTETVVTITDPNNLSIKAGEKGEGKYITTGTVDGSGNPLYALSLTYLADLVWKEHPNVSITADGTDRRYLAFPLAEVAVASVGGKDYHWSDLQHMTEDSAYIWMNGEDIDLYFKDADGTEGSVALKFYPDYGLWRIGEEDLPDELPQKPGYIIPTPTPPVDPTPDPNAPQPPEESQPLQAGGIIIHVGPYRNDQLEIPRFFFSYSALGLGNLNIATQNNAQSSIARIGTMVNRVSLIRGTYGELQNALHHISDSLNVSIENLSDAESSIRDVDMAEEMMRHTQNNILVESAQAMLAQANQTPQGVLQLLQ